MSVSVCSVSVCLLVYLSQLTSYASVAHVLIMLKK